MIGRTLSHYEIIDLLGKGGMGEVYRARDSNLKRDVALKILPADMAADPVRLERFQQEAQTVARMSHPHIVTLFSVEEAEGVHFLTMELVEGQSLAEIMRPEGLQLPRVFECGIAIADALAAAHEQGIVHRDLKPANVMLTRDGRVKVLDFGLAKLMADGPGGPDASTVAMPLTSEGTVMGTVPYMSPEQLRTETVDHRSDIFSLGILLHELAAGRRPFTGATRTDVMSSILRDAPPALTQVRPDLPRHLGRIVSRCLEKDPANRYHSAIDLRTDLRALRKEEESGVSESSAPHAAPVQETARANNRNGLFGLAAVAVAIAVVIGALVLRDDGDNGPVSESDWAESPTTTAAVQPSRAPELSIAVLPFVNMSSDAEQEYFSDGLTEELLNALVKLPELHVAGRTSSFSFKGKNEDLRLIGEQLNVAHILEGSVRKAGNRVRITAQLIKASDGFHLWSETYDRSLDDIFAIQGDVAQQVAAALSLELLPDQKKLVSNVDTQVPAAHEAYLKGRFHWNKRTEQDLIRSVELFRRAVDLDPGYARAYAGLADALAVTPDYVNVDVEEYARLTSEAAQEALRLDPNLTTVRAAVGLISSYMWEWEVAETELRAVLSTDPGYGTAHQWLAWVMVYTRRYDEAMVHIRRARELDPLSIIINSNVGQMLAFAKRYDEAVVALDRCLQLEPDFHLALRFKARSLSGLGRHDESMQIFDELGADNLSKGFLPSYAIALLQAGRDEDAARVIERIESEDGYSFMLAYPLALQGKLDECFQLLERACVNKEYSLRYAMNGTPEVVENDPRFQDTLRCLNLVGDP